MPRLRYCGRDEDGEPVWKDLHEVPPEKNRSHAFYKKPTEAMSFREKILDGYKQQEDRGRFKSAYSPNHIKRLWA